MSFFNVIFFQSIFYFFFVYLIIITPEIVVSLFKPSKISNSKFCFGPGFFQNGGFVPWSHKNVYEFFLRNYQLYEKTAANSLARSFLKLNLLIPLINF